MAIAVPGQFGARLNNLLSADPAVEVVALDSPSDAVLGATTHRPAVVDDLTAEGPVVVGASPLGLAMAMRRMVDGPVERVAVALPGPPRKMGQVVSFPSPIGQLRTEPKKGLPEPVVVGRTDSSYAAVLIKAGKQSRVIIDQAEFLRAICLAAGVALLPVEKPTPVWRDPARYLSRAETMGLVAARPT